MVSWLLCPASTVISPWCQWCTDYEGATVSSSSNYGEGHCILGQCSPLILVLPNVDKIFSPHIVAVCCPAKMPIIFFVSIFHVSECLLCKWIFRTRRKGKGMWKIKYEFCVIIMVSKEWDANKGRNIKLSFSNLSLLLPKRYKARGNFKHKNLIVLNVKYDLEGKWSLLAGRQGVECSLKMLSVNVPSNTACTTHRGVSAAKLYVRQDLVACCLWKQNEAPFFPKKC